MKINHRLKAVLIMVVTVLAILVSTVPTTNAQPRGQGKGDPFCFSSSISVDQTVVPAGGTVTVTSSIENCDNHRIEIGYYVYIYKGETIVATLRTNALTFRGGEQRTWTDTYTVPIDEASGTQYSARLRLLVHGAHWQSAPFTIQ